MKIKIEKWIGVLLIIFLWQSVEWLNLFNPIYFSSPGEVLKESYLMFMEEHIYLDIFYTLYRIAMTIFIAMFIGVPVGILFGYFSKFYKYFSGVMDFFRSIPPIVIYPLLLISLGPDDSSRIGVAVFGSVVVVILIISKGLSNEGLLRKKVFKSLGAKKIEIIKKVVWYEALPHIMLSFRTMISLSVIIIIVTEMLVGSKYGLGVRVQNVQITSNIPDLFVTIIVIGMIGFLFNKFAIWLDKKLVFWK